MGVVTQSLVGQHLIMAGVNTAVLIVLCCLSLPSHPSPLSKGHGESIPVIYGFYGNPIYRPYGFGAWGFGSEGFGYRSLVSRPLSLRGILLLRLVVLRILLLRLVV